MVAVGAAVEDEDAIPGVEDDEDAAPAVLVVEVDAGIVNVGVSTGACPPTKVAEVAANAFGICTSEGWPAAKVAGVAADAFGI